MLRITRTVLPVLACVQSYCQHATAIHAQGLTCGVLVNLAWQRGPRAQLADLEAARRTVGPSLLDLAADFVQDKAQCHNHDVRAVPIQARKPELVR